MKCFFLSIVGIFTLLLALSSHAQELLKTQTSWDGGAFQYPEGDAEVTTVILTLNPDEPPKFHCHPVPTLGYILKGTVEIETRAGKTTTLEQGQSVVEVMRTVHRGKAIGGPAEILVFYAGASNIPNTVMPDADTDGQYCIR